MAQFLDVRSRELPVHYLILPLNGVDIRTSTTCLCVNKSNLDSNLDIADLIFIQ